MICTWAYLRRDRRPVLRDKQDLLLLLGDGVLDEDDHRDPVALRLSRRAVGALPFSAVAFGILVDEGMFFSEVGVRRDMWGGGGIRVQG